MIKTKYIAYMKKNRRNLLTVAAGLSAILLTSACSADAPGAPAQPGGSGSPVAQAGGSAITFGLAGDGATTRMASGTIADTGGLRDAGFGVFACHHGIHPYESSDASANFMWNQHLTWDDANGVWTYFPVKYWPNGDGSEENKEYLTFYAYSPFSDADGSGCITDFSKNGETGDPWLVYQLGGTAADWRDHQTDLLYAFTKDQQKGLPSASRVSFDFRHALGCLGDQVSLKCGDDVVVRMMAAHVASDVTMTLNSVTLDYELTRKGRLVLNSGDEPNWKTIESEDATVHRLVTFDNINQVIARAVSNTTYSVSPYTSGEGNGIFYIPVELSGSPQRITATATYTMMPWNVQQSVSTTLLVSELAEAGRTRDLSFILGRGTVLGKPEGSIVFAEASKTLAVGDTYTNTLTNTTDSGDDDGVPDFTSSNGAVATVDAVSGEVTAVGAGTCTITATVADTDLTTYPVKTVSYTVEVTAAP